MSILENNVANFGRDWDLQREYNFEFILPDIPPFSGIEISKYCQRVTVPQYNVVETRQVKYASTKRKYPGDLDIDPVTATFLVPSPDEVAAYFALWKSLIVDRLGHRFPKMNYAKRAYLYMYNTRGEISSTTKLLGIYPTVFPSKELSYDGDGILKYDVTFSVDEIEDGYA